MPFVKDIRLEEQPADTATTGASLLEQWSNENGQAFRQARRNKRARGRGKAAMQPTETGKPTEANEATGKTAEDAEKSKADELVGKGKETEVSSNTCIVNFNIKSWLQVRVGCLELPAVTALAAPLRKCLGLAVNCGLNFFETNLQRKHPRILSASLNSPPLLVAVLHLDFTLPYTSFDTQPSTRRARSFPFFHWELPRSPILTALHYQQTNV